MGEGTLKFCLVWIFNFPVLYDCPLKRKKKKRERKGRGWEKKVLSKRWPPPAREEISKAEECRKTWDVSSPREYLERRIYFSSGETEGSSRSDLCVPRLPRDTPIYRLYNGSRPSTHLRTRNQYRDSVCPDSGQFSDWIRAYMAPPSLPFIYKHVLRNGIWPSFVGIRDFFFSR